MFFHGPNGERVSIYFSEGEIKASRLVSFHKTIDDKAEVRFELSEESDGILRLIDLLPVFFDLNNPECSTVYIIDEFDRSMNTFVTRWLINNFSQSRIESSRAQIIFTTHDIGLLDLELFRRDEIWFCVRPETGSCFRRLCDMKGIRHDSDILGSFLDQRIPELLAIDDLGGPQ